MKLLLQRIGFTTVVFSFTVFTVYAQDRSDRITLMDAFNLEYASDPQISQDSRRIVYVRNFSDVMTDKRYSNLWIINSEGTDHRPLTTGKFNDSSPRWSPDEKRILFISNREGSPQIFCLWLDTGQTARLTNLVYPPGQVSWSPDGKQIAFVSLVPSKPKTYAELPPSPEGAKWAEPVKAIDKMVYRIDKLGYLKDGFSHLFVIPSEGGTPRQITSGDFNHGNISWFGGTVEWTPDGRYLIASANRIENYEFEPFESEIHEFSVIDGSLKTLTQRKGPDVMPIVSPDGDHIAYLGFDDTYRYKHFRLYVMKRDGSGSHRLGDLDRNVQNPVWANDGKGIYYQYDDEGNTRIGYYSLREKLRDVAEHLGTGSSGRAYSGGSFSVAENGNITYTYTRSDLPGEVAFVNRRKSETKVITSLNHDLLDHKKLPTVESFWYESSFDRRKIQGWIVKPPDFDPSKKYPLILEIHGGPYANYGDRFAMEFQHYSAEDYVVLYTNPRGSTSYGEEFCDLIYHNYPGEDFFDLNSGVDAVIDKGYIDEENLFVTGGSGGGVLTCWMVGRTDRFQAAVSAYPVINWYSFVLTADITNFFYKYWFPGFPWDYPEHYLKRSPLSLVGNVKTPTMILTGEEDYRTPITESEQYYQALKFLDVETVLIRVPGEPHGVSQRPSHHMAKVANILRWFEDHKTKNE